jgi:hypothetical protein
MTWEAAVPNHGRFLRGYLIHLHPVAFGVTMAVAFAAVGTLYAIHKAQLAQRASASPELAGMHTIAQASAVAMIVTCGYYFISHYMVGLEPI